MISSRLAGLAFALTVSLATALACAPAIAQNAPVPNAAQRQADITFWTSIKDSKNPEEYNAYLQAFPSGIFAPLARLRIKQLAAGSPAPATAQPAPSAPPPAPSTAQPAPSAAPPAPAIAQPAPAGPPEPESGAPPAGAPAAPPSQSAQPDNPPPPPASPPPQPRRTVVDYTNRDFMLSLQEKLYNLNYDVERLTGVFDKNTYNAVIAVQRALKETQNGELTDSQWGEIQRARVSSTWGAISYNANATHSFSFSRSSRRDAEDAARTACKRRAGRSAKCNVMAAKDTQCIAMAKYRQRWGSNTHFGVRVYRAANIQRAEQNAMDQCRQVDRSRGRCEMVRTFCANGNHQ